MSAIEESILQMGRQARAAAYRLAQLSSDEKNAILRAMASSIRANAAALMQANDKDLAAGVEKGLSAAMLDRLRLDEARIEAMAAGIDQVATLPDPVGQVMDAWERPNGIRIEQVRVPIGTIGIIYESRPNVTADAAALVSRQATPRSFAVAARRFIRTARSLPPLPRQARPSTRSNSSPSPIAKASLPLRKWTSGST